MQELAITWINVNSILAAVCALWAITVFRERRRSHDQLGGQWLATSWGLLLLAIMCRSFLPHFVSLTLVTLALVAGLGAWFVGIKASEE